MSDIDREWEGSIRVRWVVVPPEGATVDRERVAEIVVSAVVPGRVRVYLDGPDAPPWEIRVEGDTGDVDVDVEGVEDEA